jgi:4'-phosphopantetheinyl transferase
MKIYLLRLPLLDDDFVAKKNLLKFYLHTADYGLLDVNNNSQMASLLGKIMVQYIYSKQVVHDYRICPSPFSYGKSGKPYMTSCPNFYFNISHTKEWVAVAVGDAELGIDIEKLRSYKPTVSKRFFHNDEYSFLTTLPSHLQDVFFTRLWTSKESYVKCIGTGIANSFDKFAVTITNNDIITIKGNDYPVFFKHYMYDELFISVCSMSNIFPDYIVLLNIDEILSAIF